jgi:putative transposase
MALEHHSHGYGQCAYHIVLVPKYRHRVFLDPRIKKRCEELLRSEAAREGYKVHELQVAPDHVHLFLGIGPTRSVSEAIRLLKCNTARELLREYPDLKKKFWAGRFWSSGKFYRSIGQVTADTIQHYIARSSHV